MSMTRSSRPVASTLHKVTEKIYRKRGFASAGVLVNWPAIIGEDWARHTVPERLGASGTLRLRVDGPLATEIKHLEPQILERIASYFGYRAVNRLSLIQGPLEKTQVEKPRPVRALDSDSAKTLADTIRGTRNADVKQALARLGEAVLSQPDDP
ncbi:MAG: DciA family protein [Alphaproteobacteria bacterium]